MIAFNPLTTTTSAVDAPFPRGAAQATTDFAGVLATAQELDAAAEDQARTAANQLVATALVQPILAEIRNSPFKSDLFHGGRGEEVFGQQLDTLLAERIASSPGFGVGAAVATQLTGGRAAATGPTAPNATNGQAVNVHG